MEFWKEFVRVQWDKLQLFALFVFLMLHHAPDLWCGAALGSLLTLMQAQRFKYPGAAVEPFPKVDAPTLPSIGVPPVDKSW